MDVSTVTTALTALEGNIETVGLGLIGLAVVAVGIIWIKATLFG